MGLTDIDYDISDFVYNPNYQEQPTIDYPRLN